MKRYYAFLLLNCIITVCYSQKVYFVDGYHGGIYGHYPLWNTQFYVDKLAEHPEWQICIEIEPETWDVAQKETPEAYRAFREIAADPRVEFVNPTLAQPYMYNISGESIIRQFEHGIDRIHKHFPDVRFTTYSVEEPCFTSCLPQILKSFGYKYAVLKCPNTCWGGYSAAYGGELVNWIGPDGTPILTVPRYACEELSKEGVWYTTASNNSDEYLAACFAAGIKHPVGMCFQDAGWRGGPWIGSGNSVKNNSIYQIWRNYFENVTDGKTGDDWHFSQEDVLPALMWGSQVLQRIAQQVRASENNIVVAEKMNAMNCMKGGTAVDDSVLRKAWYSLALSQHHDSWIVPYNNLKAGKTWAQTITGWTANTDSISKAIIAASLKNTGDEMPNTIKVINTTSAAREEFTEVTLPLEYSEKNFVLVDENGTPVNFHKTVREGKTVFQFMAKAPAFGYSIYKIMTENAQKISNLNSVADVCNSYYDGDFNFIIESDLYKITFDLSRGGIISSLVAKTVENKEFVDQKSDFGFGELRGFFYDEEKFRSNTESRAKVNVTEKTPGKISVEIKGEIAGHPSSQFVTLRQGQKKIDCRLKIDWKGNPGIGEYKAKDTWASNRRPSYDDRYKLLLLLPAEIGAQQVYKNAPFDVCKSKLDNTFYSTWDSIKHNVVVNWVDFAGKDSKYGLALFTDHVTSYTHGSDFPAGLTVQYSGMGLWNKNYTIAQPTEIRYALMPHASLWNEAELWTENVEWNEPLVVHAYAEDFAEQGQSLISLNKKGYEITTVEVKNGALFVRIFNAESDEKPVKINFGFGLKKIEEVQLNGTVIQSLDLKNEAERIETEISMPRFGLKTLKISI